MTTGLSGDQINAYLQRIGLTAPQPATAESLAAIQRAHLQAVPFEALDICPLNARFTLHLPDIYRKIVTNHRGGFCFEMNSLLASLLEGLGYEVHRMSAHFTDEPDSDHDQFDHMPLNVTAPVDGSRWFVDVAAGRQNPPRPVPLDGLSADGAYRTRCDGSLWHFEKRDELGPWLPQLVWDAEARQIGHFHERCAFFQDHNDSPFKRGPLVTRLTPEGRLTLSKRTLIITAQGERTERELNTDAEIRAVLRDQFGITIDFATWWEEST